MKKIEVKICGLTDGFAAEAAIEAGADYLGVVFFDKSPRNASIAQAQEVFDNVPEGIKRVGLFVDADNKLIDQVMNAVRLDMLQFHGTETPERVEAVRLEYGMPIIKALPVADSSDLQKAAIYASVADALLFDARAPKEATRPGGNGIGFDWHLLANRHWPLPWFVAGGLTPENVKQALEISGARRVDVSSGVETAPGIKDAAKIEAFIRAAKERR